MPVIRNLSIYGIYDHYSSGAGAHPGAKTGFLHVTMYFPPLEIARIIAIYSRFVILVQQTKHAVGIFQRDIQPLIRAANKPYVIVSCMDDATFPEEVVEDSFYAAAAPLLRHWFAINCSARPPSWGGGGVSTVTPIPYGIDYWTLTARTMWTNTPMSSAHTQDRHLSRLRYSAIHFSKRAATAPPRIYINFQFNMDGNGNSERLLAYNLIPRDLMSIQETPVNRYDTWGAYTQHVFVASPRGNGLDTIRTWEALMLGCIVIVRRIPEEGERECVIEELYQDLPVVIIDQWSDITRDFLDRTLSEYAQRTFRYDKLGTSYWIERFEASFNAD
jgi:hypothetical protein